MSHIAEVYRANKVICHDLPRPKQRKRDAHRMDRDGKRLWYDPHFLPEPPSEDQLAASRWASMHTEQIVRHAGRDAAFRWIWSKWPEILSTAYLIAVRRKMNNPHGTDKHNLDYRVVPEYRTQESLAGYKNVIILTNADAPADTDLRNVGPLQQVAGREKTPIEQLIQRETQESVRRAIESLHDEKDRIIVKHVLAGEPLRLLPPQCPRHKTTINQRLSRAIGQIAEAIAPGVPFRPLDRKEKAFRPTRNHGGIMAERRWTTVEARHDGVTIVYSREEDPPADAFTVESAATNTAHIEITIHRPSGPPTVERIAKGKRRTVFMEGVYKIEACSKTRGQRVKVEPALQQSTSNN
jgi:hypothetical protein